MTVHTEYVTECGIGCREQTMDFNARGPTLDGAIEGLYNLLAGG